LRGLVRVLIRHADDLGGLLLLVLGMVAGMGVYAGAGGPAGRGLADGWPGCSVASSTWRRSPWSSVAAR
jgi:hypothetical protein